MLALLVGKAQAVVPPPDDYHDFVKDMRIYLDGVGVLTTDDKVGTGYCSRVTVSSSCRARTSLIATVRRSVNS